MHSKNLSINSDAKLTEQIYEKVETLHTRSKRQSSDNGQLPSNNNVNLSNNLPGNIDPPSNASLESNATILVTNSNETQDIKPNGDGLSDNVTVTENLETTTQTVTKAPIKPIDTQVTHNSVRNIKIVDIQEATGDRLILKLASALATGVDYTLQLSFSGQISNALTGFYSSTYKNAQNEVKLVLKFFYYLFK